MPTAPDPAQRSKKRFPSTWSPRYLNKPSRTRRAVGLTFSEDELCSRLFLYLPPSIRIELSDLGQSVSWIGPNPLDHFGRLLRPLWFKNVTVGVLPRPPEQFQVAHDIADSEGRQSRLPRAHQFAWTANFHV